MTTMEATGVTLGVEHFGGASATLVLLAGGTTMLSWPDALCDALASGGRHVVRFDLRDAGELDDRPAHLAGIGVGGWSPWSPPSTTWRRSRRSPSPGRGPSHQAGSTTICPTMTGRR
jgi:hypothetical protein